MFELSFRLIGAGLAMLVAGVWAPHGFDVVWPLAVVAGLHAILVNRIEAKGYRNAGVAGLIAVFDSILIAIAAGACGQIETLGFLVLAPCAYAAVRHGAPAGAMAPLAAATLVGPGSVAGDIPVTNSFLLQAAAVLVVGVILNHRRISESLVFEPQVVEPMDEPEPDAFLTLKRNFRKLKERHRNLEIRARRDRLIRSLAEASSGAGDSVATKLAARLRELAPCETVTVFALPLAGETMVVRGWAGDAACRWQNRSLDIDLRDSSAAMRDKFRQAFASGFEDGAPLPMANVVLTHMGRVVGMLHATALDSESLQQTRTALEDAAPFVAQTLSEELRREALKRRMAETEMLYEIAATCAGADTANGLAQRVVHALFPVLGIDHFAVYWIDGDNEHLAAQGGTELRFLDTLSFAEGPGLAGWLDVGAPELSLFDTREDTRCDPHESVRRRVRSFGLVPIRFGDQPWGFLEAATHRTGGIDEAKMRMLRTIGAELGQAIGRMVTENAGTEGLTTPAEFHQAVQSGEDGCLVHLETLRRTELLGVFGRPALEHAARKLALRIRARLPRGGAVCRRRDLDFVVFLPGFDEASAASWASETTAYASMIGLRTPDGSTKIPLAIRARTADLGSETRAKDAFSAS